MGRTLLRVFRAIKSQPKLEVVRRTSSAGILLSLSSCKLDGQLTYYVRAVTLRSHNMTRYCTLEDVPSAGSDCNTFLDLWNLDKETFSDFNPSVGKKCENWALGK